MYNETKIKALKKQIESGKIKTDSAKILNYIQNKVIAVNMPSICRDLNMAEKTVSARLSGLQDIGVIELSKVKGNNHNYYKYQPLQYEQICNSYKRKEDKFNQWKKRGLTEFDSFLKETGYNLLE